MPDIPPQLANLLLQGSYGAIAVWLIVSGRQDSQKREANYQAMLDKMLSLIPTIASDVKDIKESVNRK